MRNTELARAVDFEAVGRDAIGTEGHIEVEIIRNPTIAKGDASSDIAYQGHPVSLAGSNLHLWI